ncbi:MAG: hypothetical protein ABL891_06980 [Burkholderiales bacterium]
MKRTQKLIVSIGTAVGLGIAALAVSAHPGQMGAGMGPGAQGGSHHAKDGMGHGAMKHGDTGPQAARQLMTPEERTALQEKMRSAKTPEERQQIATATRTEMEKRAKDKGITLPEHRGNRGHHGTGPAAATTPPATTGHAH